MAGEVVTVFRSRLRPEAADDYYALRPRIFELAQQMPGFIDAKTFVADDGERVTVVTFASPEAHKAWREHPEHRVAQRAGRDSLFSEYRLQVCRLESELSFHAD